MNEISEKLLKILKDLHKSMQYEENWMSTGICTIVDSKAEKDIKSYWGINNKLKRLLEKWPLSSENYSYPIPVPKSKNIDQSLSPLRIYYECPFSLERTAHMWDRKNSEYAELRWQALEWMIKELETKG